MISIRRSESQFPVYNVSMNEMTPKDMLKIDKAIRVYQLRLCNPKMTLAKACENIGIDPKTYRKYIATQDEVLTAFEQTRIENERNEYSEFLTSKAAIANGFLADAMKPGVSITERIKALDHIEKKLDEYSGRYHTVDVEAEQDLLSGPKQKPGISRLSSRVAVEEEGNKAVIKIIDKSE